MSTNYQSMYEKAQPRRELNERIKALVMSALSLDGEPGRITDDQPLFGRGLGLDSLDALELVVGIEDQFEISISDDEVSSLSTVNKIADYILASQEGHAPEDSPMFNAAAIR